MEILKAFAKVNETQTVFCATDDESAEWSLISGKQQWLWVTDGTINGTKRIYQCDVKNPGQDNTNLHTPYVRVGRRVF